MILFVNACVRKESRTKRLAEILLKKLALDYEEIRLIDIDFPKTDEAFLENRYNLVDAHKYYDESFELARQFAAADTIVIAAPYWDLSFPANLKQYIEHINILGITFEYTSEGFPGGLCKADKLYYVTTAGGSYVPEEFGFGYIKALAENFYGIREVELIKAVGLDVYGADVEAVMNAAIANIKQAEVKNAPRHIYQMEAILDKASECLDSLEKRIEEYQEIQSEIQKLEAYYTSRQWRDDFARDEAGELPDNLKRGVLSEDGIYNLLERNKEIMDRINGAEPE